MKSSFTAIVLCSVCLYAADFWVSKPFLEWSDKEVERMLDNSPWSKTISIATGGGMSEGRRGANSDIGPANDPGTENPIAGPGGSGMGGGRSRNRNSSPEMNPISSMTVHVRWQTALPIKQALIKKKYGAEAGTSDEAKKALEAKENWYVIAVAGIGRGMVQGDGEKIKRELLEQTSLGAKGKEELKPADIQMGRADRSLELYFVFPRKTEFSEDDKEIEFATKLGGTTLKQKFRLKDMMYNGKLAL